jgi:cytochrome c biogenesis protein
MEEPAVIVSTKTLEPVTEVVPGQTVTVEGQPVKLMEYQLYSGLETKRDPGIPIVYFGCGILIFGLAMVPVSHREVWVRRGERGWVLAGRTHKGRVMLRKELEAIAQVWGHEPAEPETSFQDIGVKAS